MHSCQHRSYFCLKNSFRPTGQAIFISNKINPQTTQMYGAEALQRPLETILRDMVTGLLRLSTEEQERLNSYSPSDCHAVLQELADCTNTLVGKPEHTIQDMHVSVSWFTSTKPVCRPKSSEHNSLRRLTPQAQKPDATSTQIPHKTRNPAPPCQTRHVCLGGWKPSSCPTQHKRRWELGTEPLLAR